MRLSFADVSLSAVDALSDVDAACLFVFEDERPLRGLAGYLDWRLCGSLSRILREGRFVGADGDALLFPVWGRVPVGRVFSFGSGRRKDLSRGAFALVARRACQALSRAGVQAVALQLPPVEGCDEAERARTFLAEGATSFKGERIVLLGDGKALARAFTEAGGSMKGLDFDREPLVLAPRPPAAPAPKPARAG